MTDTSILESRNLADRSMRIDSLLLENFKGFKRRELLFHPQFTLIVGENGSGIASLLDTLAVAIGSWFLGVSALKRVISGPKKSACRHFLQRPAPIGKGNTPVWYKPADPFCTSASPGDAA
jgi:hypothetical protein